MFKNILEGLKVNEEVVAENFRQSIPSAILERALMLLTERGEDRQQAHARIRTIALNIGRNPDINLIADKFQEVIPNYLRIGEKYQYIKVFTILMIAILRFSNLFVLYLSLIGQYFTYSHHYIIDLLNCSFKALSRIYFLNRFAVSFYS